MNFSQLLTSLDPTYQSRLSLLQQQMTATAYIERHRSDEAMRREQYRANANYQQEQLRSSEAMRREQYKSQEENNRLNRRYALEGQLEQQVHENRLQQMEESLKHSMLKAGFDSMLQLLQKTADEDAKKRESLHRQLENRTQTRNELFKMLAGAVIQEKLAQMQHERDKESRAWDMTQALLLKTYERDGVEATKREIDRVCQEWELTG